MRALMKKLKAEQSAVDRKEAQMYSKAFQRMAQAPDSKQQKAAQVRNCSCISLLLTSITSAKGIPSCPLQAFSKPPRGDPGST